MTKRQLSHCPIGVPALLLLLMPAYAFGADDPEPTGFLEDYSRLVVDPEEKDSRLFYRNLDYSPSDFDGFYIEKFVMFLYPKDEGTVIDTKQAAKMAALTEEFDTAMREEMIKAGANLVDQPGPRILHCRIAITDISKSKSLARVLPQTRVVGAGRGGAAMEGECVDGGSGEIVAQVIKVDKGARTSGVTTWSGAKSAVRSWAQQLAARLAEEKKAAGG